MDGLVFNRIHSVIELDTKELKKDCMLMSLFSDELTDVSHKIITN